MLSLSTQNKFWFLALIVFIAIVWVLEPIMLPFISAAVIAYFLNPVVNSLARFKMPRWLGTLIVLLGFILILVFMFVLLVPLLQSQLVALMDAMPSYIENLRAFFVPKIEKLLAHLSTEDVAKLREAASQYAGNAVGWAGKLLSKVVSGGFALFDILTLLVVTPVVAFYLLRDWPKLTEAVDALLPRQHYEVILSEMQEVDRTLSGFIRGQALVCLSLGFIYSIGLTLVGLKYGATIGIIAGLLSFIPYVGSTFCGAASLALAFAQFDNGLSIFLVVLVFLIGQSLEGYVLTPKLVGGRVGLHPVWILFALFAGGSLMGFVGVLIAVPVAAILGVLVRFILRQYKESAIYKDYYSKC